MDDMSLRLLQRIIGSLKGMLACMHVYDLVIDWPLLHVHQVICACALPFTPGPVVCYPANFIRSAQLSRHLLVIRSKPPGLTA